LNRPDRSRRLPGSFWLNSRNPSFDAPRRTGRHERPHLSAKDTATWFRSTRDLPLTRDIALFLVRAGPRLDLHLPRSRDAVGAFHQAGIHGETVYFQSQHLEPATFFAYVDGLTQFIGGIAIALGVFGRLAGFALAGDMIGAIVTIPSLSGRSLHSCLAGICPRCDPALA